MPENINITIVARNNRLSVDKNLVIGNLQIWLGNNSICRMGKETEIVGATFYVSNEKLLIGNNSLFYREND